MNTCPKPGCKNNIPRTMYACKPHWFELPQKIRNKIWKGYKESFTLWSHADKEAKEYWDDR